MGFLDNAGLTHFWGKIKDSMQDKLTGAAGQVVGFNANGTATAVQGWSNPNLLDNWYFVGGGSQAGVDKFPINQHGKTEYTASQSYTIDRFIVNGTLSLADDGVVLTAVSGGEMYQRLETAALEIGKQYTLSVLVTSLEGTAVMTTYDGATQALSIGLNVLTFTAISSSRMGMYVVHTLAGSCKLKAAKLELGSQQTLAHQDADGNWVLNDPPPNKVLELAKCQRYQVIFNLSNAMYLSGRTFISSGITVAGFVPLPVPTRAVNGALVGTAPMLVVFRTTDGQKCEGTINAILPIKNGVELRIALTENLGLSAPCVIEIRPKSLNEPFGFDFNL